MSDHHEGAARRLLTPALREKNRLRAVLEPWLARLDQFEDEALALPVGLTSIDDAVGVQLRVLARIVGAPLVPDDEDQRLLVRTRLLVVRSSGTGDDLLRILLSFADAAELSLAEYYPAQVYLGTPHEFDRPGVVSRFLGRARAGGVALHFAYSPEPESRTLRLAPACAGDGDPVAAIEAATGLTFSRVFAGSLTERVGGSLVLAPEGDGSASLADRPFVACPYGTEHPRTGPESSLRLPDANASAFHLSDDQTRVVVLVYYLHEEPPYGEIRHMIGNRDYDGDGSGFEIFALGGAIFAFTDPGAGTAPLSLAGDHPVRGFGGFALRYDPGAGTVDVASFPHVDTDSDSLSGSVESPLGLIVGQSDEDDGVDQSVALFGLVEGAQADVGTLDLVDVVQACVESVAELTTVNPDRGLGDADDVGPYGRLAGVVAARSDGSDHA